MSLIRRFMRLFYKLLYHPFAFTYDLVAAVVSFGKWKDWVFSILPYIEGTRILELGHGPGHLQRILLDRGLAPVAMDESAQMGTLARRRLGSAHKLTRAIAQNIPFAAESFDSIVSTFPTEYIFDPRTLSEAHRVLRNGGRLIVLPAAFPSSGFLKWLYKVTGETPAAMGDILKEKIGKPFGQAKFKTEVRIVEVKSGNLLIVIARKEE
ncbi:MAG: methyltransferase domain-containing protein [Anaerolineales bacterium]|nr:methyltransferase domain-containing protein [Anaerolineales bacterium]